MRILKFAAIAVAGFALAAGAAAYAQIPEPISKPEKAYGYVDLKTGIFHKMTPDVVANPELPPVTPVVANGFFQFVFDVSIVSTFPSGTVIYCEGIIEASSLSDTSTAYLPYASDYSEIGVGHVAASGKTVTCDVNIPYSWEVAPASLKPFNSYSASYTVFAILPSTSTSVVLGNEGILRESSSSLISGVIPTSGTVTKKTVNVTL